LTNNAFFYFFANLAGNIVSLWSRLSPELFLKKASQSGSPEASAPVVLAEITAGAESPILGLIREQTGHPFAKGES